MSGQYAAWVGGAAFVVTLLVFAAVSVRGLGGVKTAQDFFHSGNERQNSVKLLVASVSVGTGLAYSLAAGGRNGLLMLAGPLALCVGFFLLAFFMSRGVDPRVTAHSNLLTGFEREIARDRGASSRFGTIVGAPLVAAFLLVFAYEIFVSAQVISAFVAPNSGARAQVAISTILFLASLGYCLAGGSRAAMRNEFLQLAGIICLLAVLVWAAVVFEPSGLTSEARQLLKTDIHVLTGIGLAIVSAISTQFYSLLNMHAVSNVAGHTAQARMLRRTGIGAALIFAVMIALGAVVPVDWSVGLGPALHALLTPLMQIPVIALLVFVVVVVGLVALIMSTLDALMIALGMFATENIFRRNQPIVEQNMTIGMIRTIMTALFAIGYCILAIFNYLRPDIFYLLLAIGSGLDVFSPLIILAGVLSRRQGGLACLSDRALTLYAVLFSLAVCLNVYLSATAPLLVPFIGLSFFVASGLLSTILFAASSRRSLRGTR